MKASETGLTEEILRRGSIKDADVQRLRAELYADGAISTAEAERIFGLNDRCPVKDPSFADFFVEALTDHIVNGALPEGYLTAENAEWLIARISHDGRVDSKTELDLLVNVLDKARWSPTSLIAYALEQVKIAVLTGEGPLRSGKTLERGTVTEGEVELLRRMLYAFAGDGHIAITRAEAEVLFDINDAADRGTINPAWTDLFVKAVANSVMAASGYAPPSREEALRREAWLDSRGDLSPTAMLKAMVASSLASVMDSYREQSSEERALARLERQRIEIITNEVVNEAEATWLAERIGRDGQITANEQALVDYLRAECPKLHPALDDMLARWRTAA